MGRLTEFQSRVAAVSLLIAILAGLLISVYLPWHAAYSAQSDQISRMQVRLAASRRLAGQQDAMRQQLERVRRQSPSINYYLSGETTAIASAMMQQHVEKILKRHGGELVSSQILTGNDATAESAVTLKLHVKAAHESAWQLLYALETGRPMLFIDNLSISARPVAVRAQRGAPSLELELQFDAIGFLREGT